MSIKYEIKTKLFKAKYYYNNRKDIKIKSNKMIIFDM
jgi:hypothetical protein